MVSVGSYGAASDSAYLHSDWTSTDYNTVWTAGSAQNVYNFAGNIAAYVGQRDDYDKMYRVPMLFNTSGIPVSSVITNAYLRIRTYVDDSDTDFYIVVQSGTGAYPHDPVGLQDWDKSKYGGGLGSISTNGIGAGYNNIIFNEDGRNFINKTGSTMLMVRSDREIAGTYAANKEVYRFYTSQQGASYQPYLIVEYSEPLTQSVSDSFSISDSVSRQAEFYRGLADTFSLSDSVIPTIIYTVDVDDSFALSDSTELTADYHLGIDDSFSFTDTVSKELLKTIDVSDAFVLADSVVKTVNYKRNIDNTFVLSDSSDRVVDYNRLVTDSFATTDSVYKNKYGTPNARSSIIYTNKKELGSACLTGSYTAGLTFLLSPNNGATWEAVTPGEWHTFATDGSTLRWKVDGTGSVSYLNIWFG